MASKWAAIPLSVKNRRALVVALLNSPTRDPDPQAVDVSQQVGVDAILGEKVPAKLGQRRVIQFQPPLDKGPMLSVTDPAMLRRPARLAAEDELRGLTGAQTKAMLPGLTKVLAACACQDTAEVEDYGFQGHIRSAYSCAPCPSCQVA